MVNTISLKKNREFVKAYKKGTFYAGRKIVIYLLKNNENINRLGVTTVKNFGSSVLRNRMRRLIKENYRLIETKIETGWDIVFLIRKIDRQSIPEYKDIEKEMKYLLRKTGVME